MKIIGHYPEEGEIERDPNLETLIEHGERLLSEDFLFDSPLNDDPRFVSDIDPTSFDLNVDDVGLQDDFDLSERLLNFVGTIRKDGVDKDKSESRKGIRIAMVVLILIAMVPFFIICHMWCKGRNYDDTLHACIKTQQGNSNREISNSLATNFNIFSPLMKDDVKINLNEFVFVDQQNSFQNGLHIKDYDGNYVDSVKVHSYDWFIILFGIILSLALLAVFVALIIHIRKKDEREHEDQRLLFEHQNKMINDYANHLYSIKRVKLQQCEALLSLKQQHALQQLDFQQRGMDMLKKEQDMSWKYKEEHLNAVKEYLLNLDYEMKQETRQETKQETGKETKQGTRQVIKQETRQETRQESSVIG